MYDKSVNIIAEITPIGKAAVSAIRLSGKDVKTLVKKVFNFNIKIPRKSYFLKTEIDDVLIVFYKGPSSYTGEDVCEIFCHGNQIIVSKIIDNFLNQKKYKIRTAEPGEFTKRAFFNDKLDLIQAEAVEKIINENSYFLLQYRKNNLQGDFSKEIKKIKEILLNIAVNAELEIDFQEQDNFLFDGKKSKKKLLIILKKIDFLLNSFKNLEKASKDLKVAIVGPPNVGKSSLFNAFIHEERAIVDKTAGTTRDYLEADMVLKDLNIKLIDTAGIRKKTESDIEEKGIKKTREIINKASICVEVLDSNNSTFKIKNSIKVQNKIDKRKIKDKKTSVLYVSAKEKQGLDKLKNKIYDKLIKKIKIDGNRKDFYTITKRQESYLLDFKKVILKLVNKIDDIEVDVVGFLIREAVDVIDEMTGDNYKDDKILDKLFSNFCIGK
jgi:tRNA modification GTPase